MNEKGKQRMAWAACAAWMALIFLMSAQPGDISSQQSGLLTRIVRLLLAPFAGADAVSSAVLETIIRKGAHMAEYAVLFLLYRRALAQSGASHPGGRALLMTVCYAGTDEFHQVFVPGRGPSPVDVAIDTCGALLAWGAWAAFGRWGRKKQKE